MLTSEFARQGRHTEKETDRKSEGQVAGTNNDTYYSTCLLWFDSNITITQFNHKTPKHDRLLLTETDAQNDYMVLNNSVHPLYQVHHRLKNV